MKRSCHSNGFNGSGAKGYVNSLKGAKLQALEFHEY